MSNIVLSQDMPDFLQTAGVSELTKQLAGRAGSGVKRIVPKNGTFKLVVGGEEMGKIKGDLNAIVVNAAPKVGRIFYAKAWSPDAEPTAPDCFSNNGNTPDAKAANPQASNCNDCPQNVKGSGQGQSKACRYSRRIALVLEQDFGTNLEGQVYQMNLASKSLFGDNVGDTMTFENYSKYLSGNGKSIDYVVTRISFNDENDNQSLLFNAARYIKRNEYETVQNVANTEQTKALVVMTPSQADGVTKAPALAAPKAEEPEPVKRSSKKADSDPPPSNKKSLADVVSAWSDEG
jgi:hypothetical protein